MTEHPITPPSELVNQWCNEGGSSGITSPQWFQIVATQAARWGADQELDACCEWMVKNFWLEPRGKSITNLRAARRPKSPSLKEQALEELDRIQTHDESGQEIVNLSVIRRALDALPDEP